MTTKYKLRFTIDSQTLFGILAKFLPIEDLSVEEVFERVPDPAIRFDERFDAPPPKPPKVRVPRGERGGFALSVHSGINRIIMDVLSDGQEHTASDCSHSVKAAGYSMNGVYGKFNRLQRHGLVVWHKGKWRLTPKGKEVWDNPPPSIVEAAQ